ncbi:MAG: glycosyl transferase [Elusimicrobia bacterium]|nr:glycosyl transferase [Elusimicrobiota bacterium]
MKYGYFDQLNNEYVITRPDTPTPWINYIGEGRYGGIISNTAGGYSFDRDPRYNRVLRYRYNSVPQDQPGRYFYIRDDDTADFWSPTWQPVKAAVENYECRHGLGYTQISSSKSGIESRARYFVPVGKDFEIWSLKLENRSRKTRKISIFTYAEFCFFDAVMDQQNVDWIQQIGQCSCRDRIIYFSTFIKDKYTYFASGSGVHSHDCALETFIGKYNDLGRPHAVLKGKCSNSSAYRGNGVGAFCIKAVLKPDSEKEYVFQLGTAEKKADADRISGKYNNVKKAGSEFVKLKDYWKKYISAMSIRTPSRDMDLMVNVWNQYQCKTTFNWSRFVSLYQLGIGRGMGFRDSSQDTLGIMHVMPDKAKEMIIKLLKNQFEEGDAYHQFFPLTGKGDQKGYSDDHLWIILAVAAYLKETGDIRFLDMKVSYADSKKTGTVYEHMEKAVEYSLGKTGRHGLPLALFADWNDTINLDRGKGNAESVFVAMLLVYALNQLAEISGVCGKKEKAAKYVKISAKTAAAVNRSAWDGNWYIRAYDDDNHKLGASSCRKGKIFLNVQSWAVMSGIAGPSRAGRIMDAVRKKLNTRYGIILMWPPYDKFDPKKGGVTTYPPGAKENGGIFLHSNPWAIIAQTMMGNGDEAFRIYRQIVPSTRNNTAEKYEVEPYVFCQNILGPDHPLFGLGRNSWLTGTASWTLVAATNYILGIRADYRGLTIDPCIPGKWKGFRFRRVFRGARYDITVKNPRGLSRGIGSLEVDGRVIKGNTVPVFSDGRVHKVTAVIGG